MAPEPANDNLRDIRAYKRLLDSRAKAGHYFPLQYYFNDMQQQRNAARKELEKDRLAGVFNKASASPALAGALDWAAREGGCLMVDFDCGQHPRGYYAIGTGVAALAAETGAADECGVIVHEIRHMWQDTQDMFPRLPASYAEHAIVLSLLEADAHAWQQLAAREEEGVAFSAAERTEVLQDAFRHWYEGPRAAAYGDIFVSNMAVHTGLQERKPRENPYEFVPARGHWQPHGGQVFESAPENFARVLGRGFDGEESYLGGLVEFLGDVAVNAGLAERFFDAARTPDARIAAIDAAFGEMLWHDAHPPRFTRKTQGTP